MSPKVQTPQDAVLPPGSLILVTGVTGYVGSHVADQLLQRGYKVRGVIRRPDTWISSHFSQKYGEGLFSTYQISDLQKEEELVPAMKDVQGVFHVASDVSFSPDPNVVIPIAVGLATAALRAASQSPSVKRFVFTSSAAAVAVYEANVPSKIGQNDYSEEYITESQKPGPYGPERGLSTYAASKALAEQAVWKWVKENKGKTDIVVNSILPDWNGGVPISPENQGWPSSIGLGKALFDGDEQNGRMLPPQHFVDVQDDALLHLAALLNPTVENERVFAYAETRNANKMLEIWGELYPDRKFPAQDPNEGECLVVIEQKPRAEELLQWIAGRGWISLKQSLKETGDYWIEHEKSN